MSIWIRGLRGCAEIVTALLFLALLVSGTFGHLSCPDARVSRHHAAQAQARQLAVAVERFRDDCGRLPDQLDELFGVVRERNCFTAPQGFSRLVDPWGGRFVYWRADDGRAFELRSLGADRAYGSFDDVASGSWTWPWRPPPLSWEERGRRAGGMAVAALTLLLVLALFWRFTSLAARAVHWLWRRFRPV